MATGHHLSIGYQSGKSYGNAWKALKTIVQEMCTDPGMIAAEAGCFGLEPNIAFDYAEAYRAYDPEKLRTPDSSLVVHERTLDENKIREENDVMQMSSGGGESCDIKEAMRRAFCRIVIKKMHKLGFEVNLNVA